MKTQNELKTVAQGAVFFNIQGAVSEGEVSRQIVELRQANTGIIRAQKRIMDEVLNRITAAYPSQSLSPADYKEFCYKAEVKEGTIPATVTKKELERASKAEVLTEQGEIGLFLKMVYDAARNRVKKAETTGTDEQGAETTGTDEQGAEAGTDEQAFSLAALSPLELLAELQCRSLTLSLVDQKKADKAIKTLTTLFTA